MKKSLIVFAGLALCLGMKVPNVLANATNLTVSQSPNSAPGSLITTAIAGSPNVRIGSYNITNPGSEAVSLSSVTVEAGQTNHIGSIAGNKFADIIAVESDPIQDVTVLEHVAFVMKGGVVYKDISRSK